MGDDADRLAVVEVRQRAVEVVLSIASGAYQTSLLTYFIQRDLFPAMMKVSTLSSTTIIYLGLTLFSSFKSPIRPPESWNRLCC